MLCSAPAGFSLRRLRDWRYTAINTVDPHYDWGTLAPRGYKAIGLKPLLLCLYANLLSGLTARKAFMASLTIFPL